MVRRSRKNATADLGAAGNIDDRELAFADMLEEPAPRRLGPSLAARCRDAGADLFRLLLLPRADVTIAMTSPPLIADVINKIRTLTRLISPPASSQESPCWLAERVALPAGWLPRHFSSRLDIG